MRFGLVIEELKRMKKKSFSLGILLLNFLTVFQMVSTASAIQCHEILDDQRTEPQLLQNRWDEMSEDNQFSLLLMMLGSNSNIYISRKDIFEKGELELGLPLSNGRTLLLSYQGDSRLSESEIQDNENQPQYSTYKLTEINLVDRAAEREKLDGRPLDPSSLILTKEAVEKIQSKALNGDRILDQKNLVFPSVVTGALVERLNRSEGWIEQIQPTELASLKVGNKNFRKLYLVGQTRRIKEFMVRFLPKKFLWKALEWSAMYAIISSAAVSPAQPPVPLDLQGLANQNQIVQLTTEVARNDISEILKKSPLIVESERVSIFSAIFRNTAIPYSLQESPLSTNSQYEIQTTNGRDLWIRNRENGRIFLTVIYQQIKGQGIQLMTPVTIEIPQEQAPLSYQAISRLFLPRATP